MRATFWAVTILLLAPGAALAVDCDEWNRLDAYQRSDRLDSMIESHLDSNVGKRYTSENPVLMRACLQRFTPEILGQFAGACADERDSPVDVLDEIFDKYFLSCVQ